MGKDDVGRAGVRKSVFRTEVACCFPWAFYEGLDDAYLNIYVFQVYFNVNCLY